jgi:hypothetical protein
VNFLCVHFIKITKHFTEYNSNGIVLDVHWLVLGVVFSILDNFLFNWGGCNDTVYESTRKLFLVRYI